MPRQRISRESQILTILDRHPGKWVYLISDSTPSSKASSLRRAARRLEEKGVIDLEHRLSRRDGRPNRRRLAARRHRGPVLPHDLDVMLPQGEKSELLGNYALFPSTEKWEEQLAELRKGMQQDLWERCVKIGTDINGVECLINMVFDATKQSGKS